MTEQVDALSPAGVTELANFIIRPPRATYAPAELGAPSFSVERTPARREDLTLTNARGQTLHASHYRPQDADLSLPTVVYLHGNGSCRLEAAMLLPYVLPYNLALLALDLSGSGLSDGDYISLGVHEKHDVSAAVSYLVDACAVRRIVLWGHSMGAATALMYAGLCAPPPQLVGLVLDSPFASFDKLAQAMVSDMPIPLGVPRKLVLSVGVRAVRKAVRERAGFDVADIDPLSALRSLPPTLPALFLHGTADAVVPLHHGELLHRAYPGSDKRMLVLDACEHDSARPEWAMDQVHIFLQKRLCARGARDVQFLHQLKARGNVAMLASRFSDATVLYTHALDALAESLTSLPFADAVGEPRPDKPEPEPVNDAPLTRRNSSISNFVSTVKRWRHSRTAVAADGDAADDHPRQNGVLSAPSSRAQTTMGEAAARPAATDSTPTTPTPNVSSPSGLPNGATAASNALHANGGDSILPQNGFSASNPGLRHSASGVRPETEVGKWPDDAASQDGTKSESGSRTGRFAWRNGLHAWRGRQVVEHLKAKIPFGRSKPSTSTATMTPGEPEQAQEHPGAQTQNMDRETHAPGPANVGVNITSVPLKDDTDRIDRMFEGADDLQGVFSRRSGSARRTSRPSSSRVHIRHRGKRRNGTRRSRPSKATESDLRPSERTWNGNEETKRRVFGHDIYSKKNRFSLGDQLLKQKEAHMRRSQTEDNIIRRDGIASWDLDGEQKSVALALLGNRSLARRKAKDVRGALFDAVSSLQLDPTWVRGYVRKAAALREDGKLQQARSCVLEGLQQDPEHAGLADMLQSIDIALEAQALAQDRGPVQGFENGDALDCVSGRA